MRNSSGFKFVVLIVVLMCMMTSSLVAQNKSEYTDSILKLMAQVSKHIDKNGKTDSILIKIKEAEELAQKGGNSLDLLRVYREETYLYHSNHDVINSRKYLEKCKALLKHCSDSLEIALSYELFGVVEAEHDTKLRYYLKAHDLFTKYGKPGNQIDINFNLAILYKKTDDWKQSIKYSLSGLKAIKRSGKREGREKYLYTFLLECYVALGDYEAAEGLLPTLDSIRNEPGYDDYTSFERNYLKGAADLYYQTGRYKQAAELSIKAIGVTDRLKKLERARLSTGMSMESELTIKEEELKRAKVENELKREHIKEAKIVIAFVSLMFILASVFAIYQRSIAKKIQTINAILKEQNAGMEVLTKELENALNTQTDFLHVITHELFTPINGITIITHNLKKGSDQKSFERNLELLEFSNNYLYKLLKNLIDSRYNENKGELKLSLDVVNLKTFVRKTAEAVGVFFQASANTLEYHIDPKIPEPLYIDSIKISQILINLLNNMDKYTVNGVVTLNVSLEDETNDQAEILFEVSDTGIGIEKEFRGNIFEKFQHGFDALKEKYGGGNIGLYIIKHFLLLHNSDIQLITKEEKGAAFTFSIWFDKVEKGSPKSDGSEQVSAGRILLVDDNKMNLVITKKLLETSAFCCDTAETGHKALEKLKHKTYDLILMDIMMPGMNGFETTEKIKQLEIETPVVALTVADLSRNRQELELVDFNEVIIKPFSPNDFFEMIKRIIARSRR